MWNIIFEEKEPLKKELLNSGELENFKLKLNDSIRGLKGYINTNLDGFEKSFDEEKLKVEKLKKEGVDEFSKEIQDLIDNGEDENIAYQLVHYPLHHQEFLEGLPKIKKENIDFALKAIFLMSGSFLETNMRQICEISANHKGCNFSRKKISTIGGYKEFLKEKIGINFNNLLSWESINCCHRIIRNTIIHQNSEETTKIKSLPLEIINMIELEDGHFFFHNKLICERFINDIKDFFEEIVKELIAFFKHPYLTNRIQCVFLSSPMVDEIKFTNHIKVENEDKFQFELKIKNEQNFSEMNLKRKTCSSPKEMEVIFNGNQELKDFIQSKKKTFIDIFEEDFGKYNELIIN